LLLDSRECEILRSSGVPFAVIVPDWRTHYRDALTTDSRTVATLSPGLTVPTRFQPGSLGGHFTLQELAGTLDSMRALYPGLITRRDSIGRSFENRPIWMVKVSQNPEVDEQEPRALYTAAHHAREPMSVTQMVYFLWYLLEHYGENPDVTDLLNTRELFFVPMLNPDGYAYNEMTDPRGGGNWRKNRRDNGDGTFGVDLNRNYGYMWGWNDLGSSGSTTSNVYRGPAPFSELETRAIRDLCVRERFSVAWNAHSYGNILLYPWGYFPAESPDSLAFRRFAEQATAMNYHEYGSGGIALYVTNGDAADWMYGDTLLKPKVLTFTPEIGSPDDGFWPLPSRIVPLAAEQVLPSLCAGKAAGQYLTVASAEVRQEGEADTMFVALTFRNAGALLSSPTMVLTVRSPDVSLPASSSYALAWDSPNKFVIRCHRRPGTPPGTLARLYLDMSYAGGKSLDSVVFRIGRPVTVFADDAEEGTDLWVADALGGSVLWDTTGRAAGSGRYAFTDSPGGLYQANVSNRLTLHTPIIIHGSVAELRFLARWDIEGGYDLARVEVSVDTGRSWVPVSGRYSRPASGWQGSVQTPGDIGYDRTRVDWVEEVCDLTPFLDNAILLRFRLDSDPYDERDGIYVDNIRVLVYGARETEVKPVPPVLPFALRLLSSYPNPFNGRTTAVVRASAPGWAALRVFDLLGREVATLHEGVLPAGDHQFPWDTEGLASGTYILRLVAGPTAGTSVAQDHQRLVYIR
jgi:hypothetical protein